MLLSDVVTVARRFQRSIRVDTDLRAKAALQGFVCHASGQAVLETMARSIVDGGHRAFTWTGPYGGGKSSLALMLGAAVGSDIEAREAARALLNVPSLDQAFPPDAGGWLVVPLVGRRGNPVADLREAVADALRAQKGRTRQHRLNLDPSGRDVIERLRAEAEARPRSGVLLLLDELGKYLECAAAEGIDVHFFQELAEAAGRCNGRLVVVGILHQAFEQHAARLGGASRDEWSKVQGRYIDIPVVTAADEVIELLSRAILTDTEHPKSLETAEKIAAAIQRRRPSSSAGFASTLDACWPLHPATAALLGPVSRRRFGQNERSIFGFLASSEPEGFSEFLRSVRTADGTTYDPARLWDYLRINLEPAILASPDGHRWAQAAEAVERCEAKGDPLHVRLAKTIAVIDLFRDGSGLAPDIGVLRASLNARAAEVDRALQALEAWSIVIYRKHLDAWAIYAGSDFDIEKAVAEAQAAACDLDLGRIGRRLAGVPPILAKRHYHRSDTLRWFDTELVPLDRLSDAVQSFAPTDGSAGKFLLAIPAGDASEQSAKAKCRRASKRRSAYPVAVGLPSNVLLIRELGAELRALEAVRSTRSELEGDAVARREVTARIAATSAQLEEELRASFAEARWYVDGRQANDDGQSLTRLVSELADQTFDQAPIIKSELVNREKPSSNSQAAVRQLLHAMVAHPDKAALGIEGYPAERGLYATVLEEPGLHVKQEGGTYGFMAPSAHGRIGATLLPMWQRARSILEEADDLVPVSALYDAWTAPPFGIRRGLLPILALALVQAHRTSIAIYAEGTFQPELGDFVADLLLQNANLIQLRKVNLQGQNEQILGDLARAIAEIAETAPSVEPLAVARALVRFVFRLPPWTRKTGSLSRQSEAVRHILLNASDPHRVIFIDLPLLFEGVPAAGLGLRIGEALGELAEAYPRMLDDLRACMLNALGQGADDLLSLRRRAQIVSGLSGDLRLDAFAARLSGLTDAQADMEAIASFAINKPVREWSDRDPDQAALALADLALKFRQAELLARVKGREPTRHALAVVFGTGEVGRTVMESFDISESEQAEVAELGEQVAELLRKSGAEHRLLLAALAQAGARTIEDTAENAPEPQSRAIA